VILCFRKRRSQRNSADAGVCQVARAPGSGRYVHFAGLSRLPAWFTEGFDTRDLLEAKALLDAL